MRRGGGSGSPGGGGIVLARRGTVASGRAWLTCLFIQPALFAEGSFGEGRGPFEKAPLLYPDALALGQDEPRVAGPLVNVEGFASQAVARLPIGFPGIVGFSWARSIGLPGTALSIAFRPWGEFMNLFTWSIVFHLREPRKRLSWAMERSVAMGAGATE